MKLKIGLSKSKYASEKVNRTIKVSENDLLSLRRHYRCCGETHGKERLKRLEATLETDSVSQNNPPPHCGFIFPKRFWQFLINFYTHIIRSFLH